MNHWEGLSTVFNHWKCCFKIIRHCWATVDFVTQDGPFCHEIFKIFVVINQKLCGVWSQKLVWVVSTIGTTNTPSFVKIREMTRNSLLIDTEWPICNLLHLYDADICDQVCENRACGYIKCDYVSKFSWLTTFLLTNYGQSSGRYSKKYVIHYILLITTMGVVIY